MFAGLGGLPVSVPGRSGPRGGDRRAAAGRFRGESRLESRVRGRVNRDAGGLRCDHGALEIGLAVAVARFGDQKQDAPRIWPRAQNADGFLHRIEHARALLFARLKHLERPHQGGRIAGTILAPLDAFVEADQGRAAALSRNQRLDHRSDFHCLGEYRGRNAR